ncbi:hypothetical protein HDV05_000499 [Chytridiales sp. JEL 0842]|nr:hypothetical protein HDV05_000499 [Chytridiales sp. JEL 0842]
MAAQVTRRLLKELRDLDSNPHDQIVDLRPIDDEDLFTWRGTILGHQDSAYASEY